MKDNEKNQNLEISDEQTDAIDINNPVKQNPETKSLKSGAKSARSILNPSTGNFSTSKPAAVDIPENKMRVLESINETISPSTGNLSYTATDIHWPGKNGMDLVLSRTYNSGEAYTNDLGIVQKYGYNLSNWRLRSTWTVGEFYESTVLFNINGLAVDHFELMDDASHYRDYLLNQGINVLSQPHLSDKKYDAYFTGYKPKDLEIKYFGPNIFGLGYGWTFNVPSVELIHMNYAQRHLKLNLGDGSYVEVSELPSKLYKDDPNRHAINGGKYLSDMIFRTIPGIGYELSFKDGHKCIFKNYQLEYQEDKFGNKISYKFENDKLAQITDTYGRVLNFNHSDYELEVKSLIDGVYTTEMRYSKLDGNLVSATDKLGNRTKYNYDTLKPKQGVMPRSYDVPIEVPYRILKEVEYYNGLNSHYEYTPVTEYPGRRENDKGLYKYETPEKETYKVCSRFDTLGSSLENPYNKTTYDYFVCDDTKPRTYHGGIYRTTRNDANGVKNTLIFDKYGLCTESKTELNGSILSESFTENGYATYDDKGNNVEVSSDHGLPKKSTTYKYSVNNPSECTRTVEEFSYSSDLLGNVTKHVITTNACIMEDYGTKRFNVLRNLYTQTTDYQYGIYSMLTSKEYHKDDQTKIKEVYQVDAGGHVICEELFENGARKSCTDYRYDSNHNMVLTLNYADATSQLKPVETQYTYNAKTSAPTGIKLVNALTPTKIGVDLNTTTEYNGYGQVVSTKVINHDGIQHKAEYELDSIGRVTSETVNGKNLKKYQYSDSGSYIIVSAAMDFDQSKSRINWITTKYTYNPFGEINEISWEIKDDNGEPLPNWWHKIYHYKYDNLVRLIEEKYYGDTTLLTSYSYDQLNRVKSKTVVQTIDGKVFGQDIFSYSELVDSEFSESEHTIVGSGSTPSINTRERSNIHGNLVAEYIVNAGNAQQVATYTYNKLGYLVAASNSKNQTTRYVVDYAGNVLEEIDPLSQSQKSEYNSLGQLISSTNRRGFCTEYQYNTLGNLVKQLSPFDNGKTSEINYTYDLLGNTLTKEAHNGIDGSSKVTYKYNDLNQMIDSYSEDSQYPNHYKHSNYSYDYRGNVLSQTVGNDINGRPTANSATTKYSYDKFSNLLTSVDPENRTESYTYTAYGLGPITKTDKNGNTISYEYNALNQPIRTTASVATPSGMRATTKTIEYGSTGAKVKDHKLEQLDRKTISSLSMSYTYDWRGEIIGIAENDGVSKSITYDNDGLRTSFTMRKNGSNIIVQNYKYDNLGRLSEVYAEPNNKLATYTYLPTGQLSSSVYPNGVSSTSVYNHAGIMTKQENKKNGAVLSSYSYEYNLLGNQTKKVSTEGGKTTTTTYKYDLLSQLVEEAESDKDTTKYYYDSRGNRVKKEVVDKSVTNYSYDKNNWLLVEDKTEKNIRDIHTYRYDANGNQVYRRWEQTSPEGYHKVKKIGFAKVGLHPASIALDTREYDGFNQQVKVMRDTKVYEYTYRPDGLRHSKTVDKNTIVQLWDGQNLIAELNPSGAIRSRYYRGVKLIAQQLDSQLYSYIFNSRGDVVQRCSAAYNSPIYKYDAFGVEYNKLDTDPNPFRYCGEYFDAETQTIYLRARYYNPSTGRFTTEDPVMDDSNWYSYCGNNPVNSVDPLGLAARNIASIIGSSVSNSVKKSNSSSTKKATTTTSTKKTSSAGSGKPTLGSAGKFAGSTGYLGAESASRLPTKQAAKYAFAGFAFALDDSSLFGLGQNTMFGEPYSTTGLSDQKKHSYYTGRLVGDVVSIAVGLYSTIKGAKTLVDLIGGAGAFTGLTGGSGGGAAVAVVSFVGASALAETVYGAAVAGTGFSNFSKDFKSLQSAKNGNFKMADSNYLKKKGFDAEAIKEGIVGDDGAKFDLYVNKDTGELFVFRKHGVGIGQPTGKYIK